MEIVFVVIVFVVVVIGLWGLLGSMYFAHEGESDLKDTISEHCTYCKEIDVLWQRLTVWEKILTAVHYALQKLFCLDCKN